MAKQTPPTEYTADSPNLDLQEMYNQLERQLLEGGEYSLAGVITTNPTHPVLVTMSIIADWYEENWKPNWAEAMRWAVVNRKTPMDYQPIKQSLPSEEVKSYNLPQGRDTVWQWWNVKATVEGHPASDLPNQVFKLLTMGQDFQHPQSGQTSFPVQCFYYLYIQLAYEDFCQAWNRARAEGWDGVWRGKGEELDEYGDPASPDYEAESDFGDFFEDDAFPDYDSGDPNDS